VPPPDEGFQEGAAGRYPIGATVKNEAGDPVPGPGMTKFAEAGLTGGPTEENIPAEARCATRWIAGNSVLPERTPGALLAREASSCRAARERITWCGVDLSTLPGYVIRTTPAVSVRCSQTG
jgi:hypothetical protein